MHGQASERKFSEVGPISTKLPGIPSAGAMAPFLPDKTTLNLH